MRVRKTAQNFALLTPSIRIIRATHRFYAPVYFLPVGDRRSGDTLIKKRIRTGGKTYSLAWHGLITKDTS